MLVFLYDGHSSLMVMLMVHQWLWLRHLTVKNIDSPIHGVTLALLITLLALLLALLLVTHGVTFSLLALLMPLLLSLRFAMMVIHHF